MGNRVSRYSELVNKNINLDNTQEGVILVALDLLKTNEALRNAVKHSIEANPQSEVKIVVLAPGLEGIQADDAVKEMFGRLVFETTDRLRLLTLQELGFSDNLANAYSRAINHFKVKFDSSHNQNLIAQIAMIAGENMFNSDSGLEGQKVLKLLEGERSIQAAELLISLKGGFNYQALAPNGFINPDAEFFDSLITHLSNNAALGKAA